MDRLAIFKFSFVFLINLCFFVVNFRYKIQPRKDTEQALTQPDYDPFAERQNEHPTT